ncbi:hypothetical protein ALDI51_21550 [Alicycliphilus denitrificans]|nr:hypothetical protein ALDI51_21550 [Alicycliphilus denitrificans]
MDGGFWSTANCPETGGGSPSGAEGLVPSASFEFSMRTSFRLSCVLAHIQKRKVRKDLPYTVSKLHRNARMQHDGPFRVTGLTFGNYHK